MYARNFLETRLGIMQFNIFDSHGVALNGYNFERQYLIDKYKDTPEFEAVMNKWENERRNLERGL